MKKVFLVSGNSGSGQSWLIEQLKNNQIINSEGYRLISRDLRADDNQFQVHISNSDFKTKAFYYYEKYSCCYGFSIEKIKKQLQEHNSIALIAGDLDKFLPIYFLLKILIPEIIIIPVRVNAPLMLIRDRLIKRFGSLSKANERITDNLALSNFEPKLSDILSKFLDFITINNITPAENELFNNQLIAQTSSSLTNLVKTNSKIINSDAVSTYKNLKEIKLIKLAFKTELPEIYNTLCKLQESKLNFYLKGGLAIAGYLLSAKNNYQTLNYLNTFQKLINVELNNLRPVSNDIDWLIESKNSLKYLDLLKSLSNSELAITENWQEDLFHSQKICGKLGKIDLDCVIISRIQPKHSNYIYEFQLTKALLKFCRTSDFENILLAPAELLIIEKLLSARTFTENKFDLHDVIILLAINPIQIEVLSLIILNQKDLDRSENNNLELNLKSELITNLVEQRIKETKSAFSFTPLTLNKDTIKQLHLVDQLYVQVEKLIAYLQKAENLNQLEQNLFKLIDTFAVILKLTCIKNYLIYLTTYLIGRADIHLQDQNLLDS